MKLRQDMHIYIDNIQNSGGTYIHTLSDIVDFIVQYRFQGGPEQPIRYLEMKVNKNDIDSKYPHLIDSIVEGKTRLIVNGVGMGTFIITKIWLEQYTYDLVATGIEITLNTATLSQGDIDAIDTNTDPPKVAQIIFNRWEESLHLSRSNSQYTQGSPVYDDDFKIYFSKSYASSNSSEQPRTNPVAGRQIAFKVGMPTLVAINMCALMDDAFVFFADKDGVNTMYYVSYEDINPLAYNPADAEKNGVVNIYPQINSPYINYTKFDVMMFKQLIGLSSKNSEGSETIINNQLVSVEGPKGVSTNTYSEDMYGKYSGAVVMSDLIVTDYAQRIADNIVRRYKDPTRSITVQLSEIKTDDTGSGWEEAIPIFSYAKKIVDNVNNITLTNTHLCDGTPDNFMLRLSTYIRAYPEMTTEYTFGVMKDTTLSQELANKLTGLSGAVADVRYDGTTSIVRNGIVTVDRIPTDNSHNPVSSDGVYDALDTVYDELAKKQVKLVSGTNIKTVNNETILGSGNLSVGTVTQVKVGNTSYDPSSGVVSLPAYPTVNDASLTINAGGTAVSTFTANASSNVTLDIVGSGATTVSKSPQLPNHMVIITPSTTDMTSGSTAVFTSGGAYAKFRTGTDIYDTSNKSWDTFYQNNRGVPIYVIIQFGSIQSYTTVFSMWLKNPNTSSTTKIIEHNFAYSGNQARSMGAIVPAGWEYEFGSSNTGLQIAKVYEIPLYNA